MMKFKKTMLLVFVLILVVGLTGCDNWQSGLDEVENATGPSWDLDLSIPLLPATNVDVGEELAKEFDEDLDTDEDGNFKISLLEEDDREIINEKINIDDFKFEPVEFEPELDGVEFNLDDVSFDNINLESNADASSLDNLNSEFKVDETEKIDVSELTNIDGFEYLEFTDGSIVVEIPEEFELSDDGVKIEFAGEKLDRIDGRTFSFDGVSIDKDKFADDNNEIEIEIIFTIVELEGDKDGDYSVSLRVDEDLEWDIRIEDFNLEYDFAFDSDVIDAEDIVFKEDSKLIFEIIDSDLTFEDIKLVIDDRETNKDGEINLAGMTLQELSDSKIEFSGTLPGDLNDFEIGINPANLAWEVKAEDAIKLINDEIESNGNDKLFSEEIDLTDLDIDDFSDYIKPSAGGLEFLIELTSDIDGLGFELDGFVFDVDGEEVEVDDFKLKAGEVSELPEGKIDDLFDLIFDSDDQPEKLTIKIDGIKAINEDDKFIIYPGDNEIKANAKMNFYLEFEFVADENLDNFIYRAEPEEFDLDEDTRDALSNNLRSVEIVQEIVNELPLSGEIEIFIRGDEVDKDDFYDDGNEGIYSSGLINLKKDNQRYRYQQELDEDFIEALTEESPIYIGFRIKIPIDEDEPVRFSTNDRIELKMWSNVTVRVNSQD
ncbi:hypothetical protein I0Q91_07695 [Halanaerobiaceae bacterium Z-7014]|uniref:Uncharacterized protein n=1 Tax=Halonatronomonas betaini TaxID=2778430 RepID=A0A931ART8_9FIRM|nr:hypothetical protein [Halonatronomonas betaini]MBF8436954.1 hypothetical protein [Halonatronomonas betaini]